jgi:small subunit ribosomal protein S21
MPSVTVYDNFEKSIRKFKKKVMNAGIIDEVRNRQHYEKPTAVRKRKKAAAKARNRKRVRESLKPQQNY